MLEFQPNTKTTVSPLTPIPFAVNIPETVNVAPGAGFVGEAETVNEVETGFESDPVFRFKVIVPGPVNVTVVGLFEPEHASPPEQLQLENV
jgi:hypothetical protein